MAKRFYSWLSQFKDENAAIGDLARDARSDADFPRRSVSYRHLKDYLECKHASEDAMNVFTDAFAQYKATRAN